LLDNTLALDVLCSVSSRALLQAIISLTGSKNDFMPVIAGYGRVSFFAICELAE
jgi:hypothetical protein